MPRVIGLTGGIATGKSTVSAIWAAAGATVIDADRVAREVVEPGRPAYRLIRRHFGPTILNADGTLNRRALGALIFSDATKRRALNRRIHPFIVLTMLSRLFVAVFVRWQPVVVLDAPLLFESGTLRPFCSAVVVVSCDEAAQIDRMVSRDAQSKGVNSRDAAKQRIAAQMPLEEKTRRATIVIDNSGTEDELREKALDTLEKLKPSNTGEIAFRALMVGVAFKLLTRLLSMGRQPS